MLSGRLETVFVGGIMDRVGLTIVANVGVLSFYRQGFLVGALVLHITDDGVVETIAGLNTTNKIFNVINKFTNRMLFLQIILNLD